jgi:hypothetical protein
VLEILFHEASHLLDEQLVAAMGDAGQPVLWHAVLFTLTGEIVRRELGPAYVPYAEHNELWRRSPDWTAARPAMLRAIPDYLDGKLTLRAALDEILAATPPAGTRSPTRPAAERSSPGGRP